MDKTLTKIYTSEVHGRYILKSSLKLGMHTIFKNENIFLAKSSAELQISKIGGAEIKIFVEEDYLPNIFERFKRGEEGIEELLSDNTGSQRAWKNERLFMKCIFDLEKKVMDDYDKKISQK